MGLLGFARFEPLALVVSNEQTSLYRARDDLSGDTVALKVMHLAARSSSAASWLARFEREARLLASLAHPRIVKYVDHGLTPSGEAYMAMEWLAGETLDARLDRGPLPAADVVGLGAGLLDALGAVHAHGVVHRDIKPTNILLVKGDAADPRILDFGAARPTRDGERITDVGFTIGTPSYMAPEQARGVRDIDGRADVFSVGCVLFEALTGRLPFRGATAMEVATKICLGPVPRADAEPTIFSPALEDLIEAMMAQDRDARAGDPAALAGRLSALLASV